MHAVGDIAAMAETVQMFALQVTVNHSIWMTGITASEILGLEQQKTYKGASYLILRNSMKVVNQAKA